MAVGDRQNYNLNGTDYRFGPGTTSEQLSGDPPRYRARVTVVEAASGNNIAFTSDHAQYRDAEAALEVVREAVVGPSSPRRLNNIFAETTDELTVDQGGGILVNLTEAKALIWSFDYWLS